MRHRWFSLLAAFFVVAGLASSGRAETQKPPNVHSDQRATRLMLSNGDVYEIAASRRDESGGVTSTAVIRDLSGAILTVSSTDFRTWGNITFSITDGNTTLEGRWGAGFQSDKLAAPLEIRIGNEVFRALVDDGASMTVTEPIRRLRRGAATKLPSGFLEKVRHVLTIANSGFEEIPIGVEMFEYLFEEKIPDVDVLSETELSGDEGLTIFQRGR